jgi:hypothetical protein
VVLLLPSPPPLRGSAGAPLASPSLKFSTLSDVVASRLALFSIHAARQIPRPPPRSPRPLLDPEPQLTARREGNGYGAAIARRIEALRGSAVARGAEIWGAEEEQEVGWP